MGDSWRPRQHVGYWQDDGEVWGRRQRAANNPSYGMTWLGAMSGGVGDVYVENPRGPSSLPRSDSRELVGVPIDLDDTLFAGDVEDVGNVDNDQRESDPGEDVILDLYDNNGIDDDDDDDDDVNEENEENEKELVIAGSSVPDDNQEEQTKEEGIRNVKPVDLAMKHWQSWDMNGDGLLSFEEFVAYAHRIGVYFLCEADLRDKFDDMRGNRDQLPKEEVETLVARILEEEADAQYFHFNGPKFIYALFSLLFLGISSLWAYRKHRQRRLGVFFEEFISREPARLRQQHCEPLMWVLLWILGNQGGERMRRSSTFFSFFYVLVLLPVNIFSVVVPVVFLINDSPASNHVTAMEGLFPLIIAAGASTLFALLVSVEGVDKGIPRGRARTASQVLDTEFQAKREADQDAMVILESEEDAEERRQTVHPQASWRRFSCVFRPFQQDRRVSSAFAPAAIAEGTEPPPVSKKKIVGTISLPCALRLLTPPTRAHSIQRDSPILTVGEIINAMNIANAKMARTEYTQWRRTIHILAFSIALIHCAIPIIFRIARGVAPLGVGTECLVVCGSILVTSALFTLFLRVLGICILSYMLRLRRSKMFSMLTSRTDALAAGLPFLDMRFPDNVIAWGRIRNSVLEGRIGEKKRLEIALGFPLILFILLGVLHAAEVFYGSITEMGGSEFVVTTSWDSLVMIVYISIILRVGIMLSCLQQAQRLQLVGLRYNIMEKIVNDKTISHETVQHAARLLLQLFTMLEKSDRPPCVMGFRLDQKFQSKLFGYSSTILFAAVRNLIQTVNK